MHTKYQETSIETQTFFIYLYTKIIISSNHFYAARDSLHVLDLISQSRRLNVFLTFYF